MRKLQDRPGIQEQPPEAIHLEAAVGHALVGDRVLHPGIGGDDEVA
jgi:hypothetical protein